MRALLLACLLAACGGSKPAASGSTIVVGGDTSPDAGPMPEVSTCGGDKGCPEGELCCYPCGIEGCQDVCMAVTDCPKYP